MSTTEPKSFPRRHDLDALRGFAMLLGIGLHGALAYTPVPWILQDDRQHEWFGLFFHGVHGFRMPLFFLISGFFTAMLWRRRGLNALLQHRIRRIFLPCMAGLITIVPVTWIVFGMVGIVDAVKQGTTSVARNPDATLQYFPVKFEWPAGAAAPLESEDAPGKPPDHVMEDYGWEIRGFFHPRKTGLHYFAISSDDRGELWLSPDTNFAHLKQIAVEPNWSTARSFATHERRTIIDSGTPQERLENQSRGFRLEAGQAYAILARCHDLGKSERLAVAYNTTGPGDFVDGQDPIPGALLSPDNITALSLPRVGTPGVPNKHEKTFHLLLKDGIGPDAITIDDNSIAVRTDLFSKPIQMDKERNGALIRLTGSQPESRKLLVSFVDSNNEQQTRERRFESRGLPEGTDPHPKTTQPPIVATGRITVREYPRHDDKTFAPVTTSAVPATEKAGVEAAHTGTVRSGRKTSAVREDEPPSQESRDRPWYRYKRLVLGMGGALINIPIFHHLWFLWFLCWLVGYFAIFAGIADHLQWKGPPRWLIVSPFRFLWLIPLTMLFQWFMRSSPEAPQFGPDTSIGILPSPPILAYYAVFFGFGALYFDCDDTRGHLGRMWWFTLPLAALVIFPLALHLTMNQSLPLENIPLALPAQEFLDKNPTLIWPLTILLQALYCWTMSFALMGFCRTLLKREIKAVRYLSDSSYWLYLAHLPMIVFGQLVFQFLPLPALVKFLLLCGGVCGLLLLSYEFVIRYTLLGTFLNGPRTRPGPTARETNE